MKNHHLHSLACSLLVCAISLCGCGSSDSEPQSSSYADTEKTIDMNIPAEPSDRISVEDTIQTFGVLDLPPILFDHDGWITRTAGEYEYFNFDGTPIVKDQGFNTMGIPSGFSDRLDSVALGKDRNFLMRPDDGQGVAILPHPDWPQDAYFGGGAGVNTNGIFSLAEDGTIVETGSVRPALSDSDRQKYLDVMPVYAKDVTAEERSVQPFHIWVPELNLLYGPYPAGSAASYYQKHAEQIVWNLANEPNSIIGDLFWMLEEGEGYYIVSMKQKKRVGPFDGIEITDPAFMGGRVGKTYIFYDIDLNELYRADIEAGAAPAQGYVPVKDNGVWKLINWDTLLALPVSFTGSLEQQILE